MSVSEYVIRGGVPGKERLNMLAATLRGSTMELLARAGVRPGMRCLDVGTGGGHVAIDLARIVGPNGSVVGVDADADIVELARADAAAEGVDNLRFDVVDVRELNGAGYDLAYSRFLLTHLMDPGAVLRRIAAAVRPGGTIVLEDIDISGTFSYPASTAVDRYWQVYRDVVRRRGADPTIGPRLPGLMRDAGLVDVEMHVTQPAFLTGAGKTIAHSTFANIADAAMGEGVITAAEFDDVLTELHTFTADPTTIVAWPRIFQTIARRP